MTSDELLDLAEQTLRRALANVREHLSDKPLETLRQRPHPEAWNALECLAHLNAIARDYLPRQHRAIHLAKARQWARVPEVHYSAAGKRLLRRLAANKTFKSKSRYNFYAQTFDKNTVKSFLIYHEQLLRVVQEARTVNINRCKVPNPTGWLSAYPLGNVLEFLARHTERHVAQALRAAGVPAEAIQGASSSLSA